MIRNVLLAGLAAVLTVSATMAAQGEEPVAREGTVLSTTLRLLMRGVSERQADACEKAALAEIERLRLVLDTHEPTSEIRRLEAAPTGKPFVCSRELFEVLRACDKWRRITNGAFNPHVGELMDLWKAAAAGKTIPEAGALAAAAERARAAHWQLDDTARTVVPRQKLNLRVAGLAKGYIIAKAMAAAKSAAPEAKGMLLAIGGDMLVWSSPETPAAKGWVIAVADPRNPAENAAPMGKLTLLNGAVTSSGGYARFVEINGKKYSHIIDPRTGQAAGGVLGSTVVCADIVSADAMSTALCVMEPANGVALAQEVGAQCMVIDAKGKKFTSSGWAAKDAGAGGATATGPAGGWPAGQGVTVSLSLGGGKAYVAAWISDTDGKGIKALALWGRKSKYFKKFKDFSQLDATFRNTAQAVTRATQQAGSYTLTWDGLDSAGKAVKPGTYVVHVEVIREKGSGSSMSCKVECTGAAVKAARLTGSGDSAEVKFGPLK